MKIRAIVSASAILLCAPGAWADECIDAAKAEYVDCKGECREQFQVAKDACHNRDHDCVEICRAEREECRDATGIDEDLETCRVDKEAAIAKCKVDFADDPISRDICIDDEQVAAFQCRDAAREKWSDELDLCRSDFKTCVRACPAGSGPVIDRGQCRADARVAFKACIAVCREDLQVSKDACRNLDHACVEQCRLDREECRDPIRAQLQADIDSCNATRQQGIDEDCLVNYPDPGEAQDECIDGYQVIAFQCRDLARENARPGFNDCRDNPDPTLGYKACVATCPPATP